MRKDKIFNQTLSRRALILGGVKSMAVGGLLSRLYYLQFIKSDNYKTQAEDNRIKTQLIPPSRGLILDRNRVVMAKNIYFHQLIIEQGKDRKSSQRTLTKISKILNIPTEKYHKLKQELAAKPIGQRIIVQKNLDWNHLTQLEFHTPDLPQMAVEEREYRHYNFPHMAAHLIGYMGAVAKKDLHPDQPVLRLPEFKIGKNGIEKSRDKMLRGTAGIQHLEVNAKGVVIQEIKRQEMKQGSTALLSIDHRLQQFCHERLGYESGAAVIMDCTNGEVLAMVSTPSFDPNIFSKSIPQKYWDELLNNPKIPLMNKAITGQYPPGSTFKMMTGLAGLKAGVINEHSTVHCPGYFKLGRHKFRCWKAGGHGKMNIHSALAQSCDTFFYNVGQQIGIDKITAMSKLFGFGEELNIGIPSEKTGLMPSDEWKRRRHNVPWQGGDTVNSSIGQGYILATPLQLATMTARIANGGLSTMPRLFIDAPETIKPANSMNINPEHLKMIQRGMYEVVNHKRGTAFGKRIEDPAMTMAGKTGTSQVRRLIKQGVKQETLPWKQRHHALFVGYAPFDNPKYALSVIIEHGGGGSKAAAPVARDMMIECFRLENEPTKIKEGLLQNGS